VAALQGIASARVVGVGIVALDETQKRRPADPRPPDRRADAAALVIGPAPAETSSAARTSISSPLVTASLCADGQYLCCGVEAHLDGRRPSNKTGKSSLRHAQAKSTKGLQSDALVPW
jgi:hypothetical protein